MAKARNAGVSGAAVAATILGILFVLSLVIAIVFYTKFSKASYDRDQLASKYAGVASPEELQLEAVTTRIANRDQGTVYQQLTEEINRLRRLAAADSNVDSSNLEKQMVESKLAKGSNLLGEVKRLQAELKKSNELSEQFKLNLAEAQKRAKDADDARASLAGEYDKSVKGLQGEINDLREAHATYEKSIASSTGQLEEGIASARKDMQAQVDQTNSEKAQLEAELTAVKGQRDKLIGTGREVAIDNTIKADGQIAALANQQRQVYLSLGLKQHLVPGMTFEVFEAGEIIKPDEFKDLRGKATIEVAKVEDSTASAYVVRVDRGKSVKIGDQIVNLAFDPNLTNQFYIFGDFDIEGTGQPTQSDRKTIEAMVSRFGGVVAPELSYEVDYLVLGFEPELPAPLPSDTLDPELIAQNVAARRKFETYHQLIAEAKNLRIPVLNQNRFLTLMGYYQR